MSYNDKEFITLQQSIAKAVNGYEQPMKVKHVRATIIATFRMQGAVEFWTVALQQPIMENRITAYKFCHLLHKVLREGHHLCPSQSMRNRQWLQNIGTSWGLLNDWSGQPILQYTKFLCKKIEFHTQYERFPLNLCLNKDEIDSMGSGDLNYVYQLTVDIFDYLDELIGLQATIYNSMKLFKINSMTTRGQLLLSVIPSCMEDSNPLYDISVRFMFRLHANLPHDLMNGHRVRFSTIFHQLARFYDESSSMQYIKNLVVDVPKMPVNSPNFSLERELNEYRSPVLNIPEEVTEISNPEPPAPPSPPPHSVIEIIEPENLVEIEEKLIDTNFDEPIIFMGKEETKVEQQPNNENYYFMVLREKDYQIQKLHDELTKMRNQILTMETEHDSQMIELRSKAALESEQKVKIAEEKFLKLKAVYTQTRDAHVKLIREQDEINKKLIGTQKQFIESEKLKNDVQVELQEIQVQKNLVEEQMQQNSNEKETQKQELSQQLDYLRSNNSELKQNYETLEKVNQLKISTLEENIQNLKNELEKTMKQISALNDEKQIEILKNQQLKNELGNLKEKQQENFLIVEQRKIENLTLTQKCNDIEQNNFEIIENLNNELNLVRDECEKMKNLIKNVENEKNDGIIVIDNLRKSIEKLEGKLQQINDEFSIKTNAYNLLNTEFDKLKDERHEIEILKSDLEKNLESMQKAKENIETQFSEFRHEKLKQEDEYKSQHDDEITKNLEIKAELNKQIVQLEVENKLLKSHNEEHLLEINDLKNQLTEKIVECHRIQQNSNELIERKELECNEVKNKLEESQTRYESLNFIYERQINEKNDMESDLQDLLHQQQDLETQIEELQQQNKSLENALLLLKIQGETALQALLETCIKSSKSIASKTTNDLEISSVIGSPTYFHMISEELDDILNKLGIVHEQYILDNSKVEGLARKVILGGHLFAALHIQGLTICNHSADIEKGEHTAEEMKDWSIKIIKLFENILAEKNNTVIRDCITEIRNKLQIITKMIGDLTKKCESSEQIADLIEAELAGMDKSIDEAAKKIEQMLSQSRESDSGLKLEVNEKILDACTNLMKAIRVLVKNSRVLQQEIIALGKGSASVKEFYKRNHQWTEGMISAAKNVAQGANFLVTAANKAVTGESKHQLDLIVAAQEIAASTAQLVVASRVKAPRGSKNLVALGDASKKVTQATGAVVATAKDSNQRLEDSQDLDLTNLTVHQAKTLEMEIQVKVLEYEQNLQKERLKLAEFRRRNYSAND